MVRRKRKAERGFVYIALEAGYVVVYDRSSWSVISPLRLDKRRLNRLRPSPNAYDAARAHKCETWQ